MNKHTEEPWRYQQETTLSPATGGSIRRDKFEIYRDSGPYGHPATCDLEADARRIVACVNACKGIPTEALEAGVVADAVKRCREVLAAWDTTPLQYLVSAPLREVDWDGIRAVVSEAEGR